MTLKKQFPVWEQLGTKGLRLMNLVCFRWGADGGLMGSKYGGDMIPVFYLMLNANQILILCLKVGLNFHSGSLSQFEGKPIAATSIFGYFFNSTLNLKMN
jgi:hypothetical protein